MNTHRTLFRDPAGGPLCPAGSVVCIGAFDGLHLGHRVLIGQAVNSARMRDLSAVALSFEPLPREFFATGEQPPRLMLPRAKYRGLRALGIDLVGLLRFNAALAAMSAEDFIEQLLVRRLRAREVWVGPDFRFGKGRAGDVELLRERGVDAGFSVHVIDPVVIDGERVSSSRIRTAFGQGDFTTATRLLGRPYAISGKVVRGRQLGRALGYPTANLRLGGKTPALSGIYAVWVHGVGSGPLPAVASLGTRPTVGGTEPLLESHLFDFHGDLYGQRIAVEFAARLRAELKFESLPKLMAQMHCDAQRARAMLYISHSSRLSPESV